MPDSILIRFFTVWSITVAVIGFAAIFVIGVWLYLKMRDKKIVTGNEGLTGSLGTVIEDLDPYGLIKIQGDIWQAYSVSKEIINKGSKVKVTSVNGLLLNVIKAETEEPLLSQNY